MQRLFEATVRGAALALIALAFSVPAQAEIAEWNCGSDADCVSPSAPYCDLSSGDCVPCLDNEHCEIDEVCHQHECILACSSDADCAAPTSYCSDAGMCFECLDDSHCSGDSPFCLLEPDSGTCVECIIDEDCPEATPWCSLWANSCVECGGHDDCPEDQHCSQDTCMPDICEPWTLSCDDSNMQVLQCNAFGSAQDPVEHCPNSDCEDGACGSQGTGTGGSDDGDTGSETDGPFDPTATTGGNGAPQLTDRGCSCSSEADDSPDGVLGLMLLVLLGLRGSVRRGRLLVSA